MKKYIKIREKLFYFAFLLYCILWTLLNSMIGYEFIPRISSYIHLICIVLVFLNLINIQYINKKRFIRIILIVLVCLIIYFKVGDIYPLILVSFFIGAYDCDCKTLCKIFLASVGIIVLLSLFLSLNGILEDRIFIELTHNREKIRHSMGMTYVTIFSGYISFLSATWLYLRGKKINYFHLFMVGIISIVTYFFTYSELNLFITIALIVFIIIDKKYLIIKKFHKIIIHIFLICFIISFLLSYWYIFKLPYYIELNDLFNNRLMLSGDAIMKIDFSLFGTFFRQQGYGTVNFDNDFGYFFIDSFYINYILQYGIIFMLFINVLVSLVNKKLYEGGDYWTILFICYSLVQGIVISSVISPHMSPFIVFGISKCGYLNRIKNRKAINE